MRTYSLGARYGSSKYILNVNNNFNILGKHNRRN